MTKAVPSFAAKPGAAIDWILSKQKGEIASHFTPVEIEPETRLVVIPER